MHSDGALTGVGLSAVRWEPTVGGVAALLAYDGAALVAAEQEQRARPRDAAGAVQLVLALGESPLAATRAEARAGCPAEGVGWCTPLEALFTWLHAHGNWLYNTVISALSPQPQQPQPSRLSLTSSALGFVERGHAPHHPHPHTWPEHISTSQAGITLSKRRWRARESTTYCAVDASLPWRQVLAVLWLAVAGDTATAAADLARGVLMRTRRALLVERGRE
jgi:hypothetical protein